MKKREWNLNDKQQNIANNLMRQVDKAFDYRTHHQGARGIETYRARTYEFCKHLAKDYGSQNFRNINEKHLTSFVEESKRYGVSSNDIMNSLSAIRKLHSLTANTRYDLPSDNKQFALERRVSRGVDRAWTKTEIEKAVDLAKYMNRYDVANALSITKVTGTRLEEVTALRYEDIKDSVRNGHLALTNTKGGIPRDVPLSNEARAVFQGILKENTTKVGRMFTSHGKTHHEAMKSIQNWIYNHRGTFKENIKSDPRYLRQMQIDVERKSLTFHGIRHYFSRENYQERIDSGMSEKAARQEVANLIGHGRDDVTRIYLGTLG